MQNFDWIELGAKLGIVFVPFLFALCFHEFAHGLVAKWRGDRTAEMAGRLSLNPFVHADLIGTWVLPIAALAFGSPFFFGWAKPVPVNSRNLKRPRQDMFWVALAGPASNLFLALVSTVLLAVVFAYVGESGAFVELLRTFIMVNMFLAVFNLIPVHPLDGGKVIEPFLPVRWSHWLDQNQASLSMFLLVALLLLGNVLAMPVEWATNVLIYTSAHMAGIIA